MKATVKHVNDNLFDIHVNSKRVINEIQWALDKENPVLEGEVIAIDTTKGNYKLFEVIKVIRYKLFIIYLVDDVPNDELSDSIFKK